MKKSYIHVQTTEEGDRLRYEAKKAAREKEEAELAATQTPEARSRRTNLGRAIGRRVGVRFGPTEEEIRDGWRHQYVLRKGAPCEDWLDDPKRQAALMREVYAELFSIEKLPKNYELMPDEKAVVLQRVLALADGEISYAEFRVSKKERKAMAKSRRKSAAKAQLRDAVHAGTSHDILAPALAAKRAAHEGENETK